MQDLPQFHVGAEFVEPDQAVLAKLSPDLLQALDGIRRTYKAVKDKETEIDTKLQPELTAAEEQFAAAEEAVKVYGPYDHFRLWQQVVQGR